MGPGPNQERLTAEALLRVYQDLGYDGVGVGPFDLSGGLSLLEESSKKGFPWISANLMDKNGTLLFRRWVKKEVQGVEVMITALTGSFKQRNPPFTIAPWQKILPALLADIPKGDAAPFVVLLSSLTHEENVLIAEQYPTINLLLGADPHKRNTTPRVVNNTLLIQTEKQGKYQGLLEITFGEVRKWGEKSEEKLAALQNRLGSLDWQIQRLDKRIAAGRDKNKFVPTLKRLRTSREQLQDKINQEKGSGSGTGPKAHARSVPVPLYRPEEESAQ